MEIPIHAPPEPLVAHMPLTGLILSPQVLVWLLVRTSLQLVDHVCSIKCGSGIEAQQQQII